MSEQTLGLLAFIGAFIALIFCFGIFAWLLQKIANNEFPTFRVLFVIVALIALSKYF